MQIVEASQDYLERLFVPIEHPRRGFWKRHLNGVPPFEPQGFAIGAGVPAEVYEGQWIVRCDGERCRNAQLTSRDDKRFFCVDCLNADHGGQWARVRWPDGAEKGEAVLLARPNFAQRNWLPHESLADLVAQNREHRHPVPEGVE